MTGFTDDGREFPVHNGELLSWSLSWSALDKQEGFPRLKAVISAMRLHRPDQLEAERRQALRDSFNRMFGHNARVVLDLIDGELQL